MSQITLKMLDDATLATIGDSTPAEQGEFLAELIRKFDAESTPAPARKPARKRTPARKAQPQAAATMRMTKRGAMMPVKAGTATKGQIKRLTDLGVKNAAKLSMADAADKYFDLKA